MFLNGNQRMLTLDQREMPAILIQETHITEQSLKLKHIKLPHTRQHMICTNEQLP